MEEAAKPNIPATFAGRCVLITGATGFIGKVLVEKILRCCPEVKRLYLLIRPGRKGDSIQKRLENLTKAKVCCSHFRTYISCSEKFISDFVSLLPS